MAELRGSVVRPPLRYHGGKWKLAPWIISQLPVHRIYVEPFAGSAGVLLRKPRSYSEVYNDRWDVVVNVFQVLRDPAKAERLRSLLELTPYARTEFELSLLDGSDDIERARCTILRSFAGFGSASTNGDFATGFRANSNRLGTVPAHDWRNYPAAIPQFVDRLRGVVIENRDALDVIATHDSAQTLFYCDPPYVHKTRNFARSNAAYACEMSDGEHIALAGILHDIKGMAVLSGYPSDLYDRELYRDWHREERKHYADGARPRIEVLWANPAAAHCAQARLL